MATATSQYIKINELYGKKEGSTTLSAAKAVYKGSTSIKRMWAGSKVVWDVWDTTLSANNFTIPASGGAVVDYIDIISKMVDIDGVTNNINYSIGTKTISPNTATSNKTHSIVITQELTGKSITVTCTQEANTQLGITYGTPSVVSATTNTIDASGGSTGLTIKYSQTKTTSYSNGTSDTITITGTTTATSISGNASVSGASKDDAYVEMISAGTTSYSSARTVYTITSYTFNANGKSKTVTGASIAVKQEANIVEYTTATDGGLSISAYPETVLAANHGSEITVTCYKNVRDVYTSGAYGDPVRENAEASITSSTGTFYPHSPIMGGSTTTFSPYENSTNQKVTHTVNASVTIGSNTYTDSCTIIQDPVSYEFEVKPLSISGISYLGQSDLKVNIISTKNGNQWDISRSNVSVSGGTGLTYDIELNDNKGEVGAYTLTINVGAHSNTTAKTFYVTVTQPESGNSERITIYQGAKPSSGGGTTTNAKAIIDAYFLGGDYSAVIATIELNEDAMNLASNNNVIVQLQNVTEDVIDSWENPHPITTNPFEYTLANGNMEPDVWVVVKCNNIELGKRKVEG